MWGESQSVAGGGGEGGAERAGRGAGGLQLVFRSGCFPTLAICSAVRSQHLDCNIRPHISSRSCFMIPSRFRIGEHNNICLRAAPWRPAKLSGNAESWFHVLTRFWINLFLVSEIIYLAFGLTKFFLIVLTRFCFLRFINYVLDRWIYLFLSSCVNQVLDYIGSGLTRFWIHVFTKFWIN